MSTLQLYYDDPYGKRANALVTRILDEGVMFDQSIFYPTGGGQRLRSLSALVPHPPGHRSNKDRCKLGLLNWLVSNGS